MKLRRKKMNEKGALEGLPLYLIILVVVAGIGTAVLAGWMMSSQTSDLGRIEIGEGDSIINTNSGQTLTILAYDQNDNPLEGATVTLEGCDVTEIGETDSDGEARFSNINPNLPSSANFGTIEVTVTYTGSVTTTRNAQISVQHA